MYNGLLHLHNLMRWIILILLVVNVLRHLTAMAKPWSATDKKLGLFLMISAHLTLVLGLFQYFTGDFGYKLIAQNGFGNVMKDAATRFWAVEHIVGMILAIALITLGKGVASKPISDGAKHKKALMYFLIALIIIIAVIPWPGRAGIGRAIFPGM